jgi:hypothetical protein
MEQKNGISLAPGWNSICGNSLLSLSKRSEGRKTQNPGKCSESLKILLMNQLKEPVYQESYNDNPQNDTTGVIAKESSAQGEGKLSTLIGLAQEVGDNLSGTSEIGNTARQKANGEVKNAEAVKTQPTASPKSAVLPVLLNIIPGLGIGSFVEGDTLGGLVCLGGTVLGWTLVVSGSRPIRWP